MYIPMITRGVTGSSGDGSAAVALHESRYHAGISARVNDIGVPGAPGFGVGICPQLPTGMTPLTGYDSPLSDNYGNYQYQDGSVMCWIPAFFYRIPAGLNVVEVLPYSAFPNVTAANAAGFALHRAFYDGAEQPGFFVDKYQWSAGSYGGNTIASSIKNGNPLSSNSAHNPWGSLTGLSAGDNIYGGAIPAAKTRGANFACISRFQWGALALLSLAHGMGSSGPVYCAWYDATGVTNFPKGCNNNALKDTNDTSVTYVSDGYSNCGKTGSGTPLAKTTHNGQNSGVADLNGNMWEVNIGLTCVATSKTITGATQANPVALTIVGHGFATGDVVRVTSVGGMTQLNDKLFAVTVTNADSVTLDGCNGTGFSAYTSGGTALRGAFHAALPTTRMRDFTSGAALATDHWGVTGVAAMMAPLPGAGFLRTDYAQNGFDKRYGRGANAVLSGAVSGTDWIDTGLGLPGPAGISDGTTGSNLFGSDNFYQTVSDLLCPLSGGYWFNGTHAGVWALHLSFVRTNSLDFVGGRAGLYL